MLVRMISLNYNILLQFIIYVCYSYKYVILWLEVMKTNSLFLLQIKFNKLAVLLFICYLFYFKLTFNIMY